MKMWVKAARCLSTWLALGIRLWEEYGRLSFDWMSPRILGAPFPKLFWELRRQWMQREMCAVKVWHLRFQRWQGLSGTGIRNWIRYLSIAMAKTPWKKVICEPELRKNRLLWKRISQDRTAFRPWHWHCLLLSSESTSRESESQAESVNEVQCRQEEEVSF